jgi:hypothetical protein
MTNNSLKAIIKQIIKEELLDEISTTGGASGGEGPPETPYAFSKRGGDSESEETDKMKKIAKDSMPERDSNVVDIHNPAKLDEARARYYNFRESNQYKKPHSKVSYVVQEIKKMLKEVDYLANISTRLKSEANVGIAEYWGKTEKDLTEIVMYTKKISEKISRLR